jgi:hypothetical protein
MNIHLTLDYQFPAILAHELDGLQKITSQNVRLRVEPKLFCHSWAQYGDYPAITLPDGRVEIALGDLVSEESREFVLLMEVLPLPLLPGGVLPPSLEGEELLGLEFVWTEICGGSRTSELILCHFFVPGYRPELTHRQGRSGRARPRRKITRGLTLNARVTRAARFGRSLSLPP